MASEQRRWSTVGVALLRAEACGWLAWISELVARRCVEERWVASEAAHVRIVCRCQFELLVGRREKK